VNPAVTVTADVGACIGYLIAGAVLAIFADHVVLIFYAPQIRTTPRDIDAASSLSTGATPDSEPPP
jgi:glycerol uptake facilitator-like aquaporin